ncbi:class I SAM-dependent methyltransferase [Corallococcus exercitus]|uniref:S-adenosyl-L-methionine-dependent methyltransferase n=1 Tax=Corallococcus exercitus TaxID=2316736 RepID=A0A7Y4KJQ1_9BACT|nr:class I SAM-dependent methyltransferase [Corallococcus exercitus]NOK34966.1 class I SAM-dependent methyltransferase [Corallococcus exercitus]
MADTAIAAPDHTAVRVALWRALHVQVDAAPHVLEDEVGLQLVAPDEGWRQRPDMHPARMARSRASIVARARFIEDVVEARAREGVSQYVLLGAGLDTFAQRRRGLTESLSVFEVEQPDTQVWKRSRLAELGLALPEHLHFVPVDFKANESWLAQLVRAGFDPKRPAVIASTGVAMYLTKEANMATLRQVAGLAPGSTFAMSFILPFELIEPEERAGLEGAARSARAAGTPFLSFFTPEELLALAREAGFADVQHVSAAQLTERYFAGRADGLRPGSGEAMLVATT